ncbi:MAG: hypothetical protein LBT86_07970 [Deltaproteobacteria bacterium]|nr:hypothetical protein [Deltaproteobacteria bacterium]
MSFFSPNRSISRSPLNVANEEETPTPHGEISPKAQARHESRLINEISLILAEKRTALSVLRTGLAVLVLPLSVVSLLVAVSRYYDPSQVFYLLAPLLGLSIFLTIFGLYLVFRAWRRTMALDRLSLALKKQNPYLLDLTECLSDPKENPLGSPPRGETKLKDKAKNSDSGGSPSPH